MLIPNWREVARKAWSIKLMLVAGLFSGLETAMQFAADSVPQSAKGWFAAASGVIVMAAIVSRLLAQKEVDDGK